MIFSSGIPFFISCMNSSQEEVRFRRQGKQDWIVINAQSIDFSEANDAGAIEGEIGYAHILSYAWGENGGSENGTTIGWLDERANDLYYPQLMSGRFPEKTGEIAIEKVTLQRMGIEAELGDTITLKTLPCNDEIYLAEEIEKEFVLVGILSDRKANLESMGEESLQKVAYLPSAFVCRDEQVDLGGKEALIAFINISNYDSAVMLHNSIAHENRIETMSIRSIGVGDPYTNVTNDVGLFAYLSVLLAFISCFGIVNAFNSNLKERKMQIGMLRAVGATKRQIINIFGREALIICIIATPISVSLSYFAVKMFAHFMGDNFVFSPDFTVLIKGALFGVLCVMLSALIPLVKIAGLTPMQAIRDVELMRKMKTKKIRSKKGFNVPQLIAKRKLTFSKDMQIGVCIIVALSTVISCMSISFLYTTINANDDWLKYDYKIDDYGHMQPSNSFINHKESEATITENDVQEVLDLLHVEDVYGTKTCNVNLIVKGHYPEYFAINEYLDYGGTSSRFVDAEIVAYSEVEYTSGSPYPEFDIPELTEENVKEYKQAAENSDYTYTKKVAGYTDEIFNTILTAESEELLKLREEDIIAGEINLEKLNAGEEVVICAPEKIGYAYHKTGDNAFRCSVVNLCADTDDISLNDKEMLNHVIATAESPFEVGDTITLSLLSKDDNGNVVREDREVTVGAILGKKSTSSTFGVYTTLEGIEFFNEAFNYKKLDVVLKEDCTFEVDEYMQNALYAIFPGKDIASAFAFNESERDELRTIALSVVSFILVFICVCISLINNFISAQIREGKRTIGTLRAVGASKQDVTSLYALQITRMLLLGFGTGFILYFISHRAICLLLVGEYMPIVVWPALIVFAVLSLACYINLAIRIRTVTKYSIVENIREL